MPLNPDDTLLLGRYRVQRQLGRGGFGHVYLAEDTLLREEVALKELIPGLAGDDAALKRFLVEAKATMRLTHDRIVNTLNVFPDGGNYYIVMEYMAGGSLEARLRELGPLAVEEAVEVAAQVCEGLAYAHGRGVVHCDLKPANILFAQAEEPAASTKVADFGIAHVPVEILTRTWMTPAGFTAGTLPYMSPEQINGRRDDPRVDLYAVGAVLYRALTGSTYLDFDQEETPGAQADNVILIRGQQPSPPSSRRDGIPPWLDAAVLKALAKAPDERYQSAEKMRKALLSPEVEPEAPTLLKPVEAEPEPEPPTVARIPEREPEPPTVAKAPEPEPEAPIVAKTPEPAPEPPKIIAASEPESRPEIAAEGADSIETALADEKEPVPDEPAAVRGGRHWVLLLIEGLALVIGAVLLWALAESVLGWPGVLIVLFAIYWLISGFMVLASMCGSRATRGEWTLILIATVSIAIGACLTLYPAGIWLHPVFDNMVWAMGIWGLAQGLLNVFTALRGRAWSLALLGAVQILLSICLIVVWMASGVTPALFQACVVVSFAGGAVVALVAVLQRQSDGSTELDAEAIDHSGWRILGAGVTMGALGAVLLWQTLWPDPRLTRYLMSFALATFVFSLGIQDLASLACNVRTSWAKLLRGLAGVALGACGLLLPFAADIDPDIALLVLGLWAILEGMLYLVTASRHRDLGLGLLGGLTIILGLCYVSVWLLPIPRHTLFAAAALFAAGGGILLIVVALRQRRSG